MLILLILLYRGINNNIINTIYKKNSNNLLSCNDLNHIHNKIIYILAIIFFIFNILLNNFRK